MAIPFVPIIAALAPLALEAMKLFGKRRTVVAAHTLQPENADISRIAESLHKRMSELEESDVEQARLISELSKNLQRLAEALQSASEERATHETRQNRFLMVTLFLIAVCLSMCVWALLR